MIVRVKRENGDIEVHIGQGPMVFLGFVPANDWGSGGEDSLALAFKCRGESCDRITMAISRSEMKQLIAWADDIGLIE